MGFSSDLPLQSNQLPISLEIPKEPKEMREFLQEQIKRISSVVNTKGGALYIPVEQASFQKYFTSRDSNVFRDGYRMVVDFGPLPASGDKRVPHNIKFNKNFALTDLYAAATDPVNLSYIIIPYVASNPIKIELDAHDVIISVTSDRSSYTICYVVIEYLKQN